MIFPVPVFLKRFAAALHVLILGIFISSLIRGSVLYFTLLLCPKPDTVTVIA
jgi:hypothetical protein